MEIASANWQAPARVSASVSPAQASASEQPSRKIDQPRHHIGLTMVGAGTLAAAYQAIRALELHAQDVHRQGGDGTGQSSEGRHEKGSSGMPNSPAIISASGISAAFAAYGEHD